MKRILAVAFFMLAFVTQPALAYTTATPLTIVGLDWSVSNGSNVSLFDSPPRPVYQALADVIRERKSQGTTKIDSEGMVRIEGYAEDHLIEVHDTERGKGAISLSAPTPDIKANGSEGPITITPTTLLSITLTLNPGSFSGTDADWWVAARTPFGVYWFTDGIWTTSFGVTYQGPLLNLSLLEVLNIPSLPLGTYTFYFGVDRNVNEAIDLDSLNFDSVMVNVTSSPLRVGGLGPYATIQDAINAARNGDTIQVAQGAYTENITITTSKTISLQGGWNSDFTSRSGDSSFTHIDGRGRGTVFAIGVSRGVSVTVGIDGFTIRNGMASEGGGIRAEATDRGSEIRLVLTNNAIKENVSTHRGGGIFIQSFQNAAIETDLTNNTISENTASHVGGGIRVNSNLGGSAVITLTKNVITRNTLGEGGWDGGGIAAYASLSGKTTLSLNNNLITENKAVFGGGVFGYAWGSDALLDITLTNNIIAGNNAEWGGAIFSCSGVTDPTYSIDHPGGSVFWKLTNNTITGNAASQGNAIQIYSGSTYGDGGSISVSMRNDIVWGNHDPHLGSQVHVGVEPGRSGVAVASISYSNVGLISTVGTGTYTVNHVIDQDPRFVDPANQDFLLQDGSPAIDAGDPNPVYNDGHRPPGRGAERADMGAYGGPSNGDWP